MTYPTKPRVGSDAGPADGSPRLADTIALFLGSKRSQGRTKRTVEEYRKKLGLFLRWMARDGRDPLHADVSAGEIEGYMAHLQERGVSDSSRKSHLAVLRSFSGTVSKKLKVPDPFWEVRQFDLRQANPDRTILKRREADLLLSIIKTGKPLGARDRAIVCSMLFAGLRIQEVTDLRLSDVHLEPTQGQGGPSVVLVGANSTTRKVPMNPKLESSLRLYLAFRQLFLVPDREPPPHLFLNAYGGKMSENTVRRTLYKYVRRAGLSAETVQPHNLRGTFAARFLQENPGQLFELAQMMGYSDPSSLIDYVPFRQSDVRLGIDKL